MKLLWYGKSINYGESGLSEIEWWTGDKLEKLNVDVDYNVIDLIEWKQRDNTTFYFFCYKLDTLNIYSIAIAPSLVYL